MEIVSYQINEELKKKIEGFYSDYQQPNKGDYVCFFARIEGLTITIFESKKGFKVVFSGENALYEAKIFNPNAEIKTKENTPAPSFLTFDKQCGSDEVGFGDFFGPLIVVGAYFDSSLLPVINSIKDSKKLTDSFILSFVPTILDKVIFSKLTVNNSKYNQLIEKGHNMNKIKALLHNQVLNNLKKKIPSCKLFYIDQFCDEKLYYHYLQDEKCVLTNICFKTKGESYFPSVALASMIARYCFLKEMEVLNNTYKMEFPKGASLKVDNFAKEFIKKYSLSELKKVCKTNFSNYKDLIKEF